MSDTVGKVIRCRAAILWELKSKMKIEEIEVAVPVKDQIRVKIIYNALCHSDLHVIDGSLKTRLPIILGHEATGIVESVGDEVKAFKTGDVVIPLYQPQCRKCAACQHGDTNLCTSLSFSNEGSHFTCRGKQVFPFMGLGTFSEYAVIREHMLVKIDPRAPLDKACLAGCGLATGYGAAVNTAQIRRGERVAVIGLGGVGLSAIQGAKNAGASAIYAIDINSEKFDSARKMGATHCVNPRDVPKDGKFGSWFIKNFGAVDKSLECIGNVQCMKDAVEIVERGWGRAVMVGIAPDGATLSFNPGHLTIGKTITGSIFGGWKSIDDIPMLVEEMRKGKIEVDPLITHRFDLEKVDEAVELLKNGKSIRSVISLSKL
ncbi:unnamed protein product, partial [Mesorhabditis belari]|uniref:Enoyl reductase (ER) domain-containing protein n=1 Tax=Mesorhabditis belari TaxID=2138241 RepID=A0AAF3FFV8_9BILA